MTRRRMLCAVAIAGVAVAAVSFVFLFISMPQVDFIRHPVSIYENEQPGTAGYIVATAGIAVACAALALLRHGWLRPSLAGAALTFVAAAVFPTDPGTGLHTVAGHIHRYASGTGFVLVIIAGFLAYATAERGRKAALLWLSITNTVLMGLVVMNTFLPTFADGRAWRGLPQRALLFTLAAVLVVIASARESRGSRQPRADLPSASLVGIGHGKQRPEARRAVRRRRGRRFVPGPDPHRHHEHRRHQYRCR